MYLNSLSDFLGVFAEYPSALCKTSEFVQSAETLDPLLLLLLLLFGGGGGGGAERERDDTSAYQKFQYIRPTVFLKTCAKYGNSDFQV